MKGRLDGLDALRGIAAIIVVASHFRALVLGQDYIYGAGLQVDFFFMLSGYIMARTYEGRMPSPVRFLMLRTVRLWPAFAIGTCFGAAFGLAPAHLLPLALLFLPIPAVSLFAFNPPAWSLFFELVANWLHSAVLAKVNRLALILALLVPSWLVLGLDGYSAAVTLETLPEGFLRVAVAYTIGVLLWRRFGEVNSVPPFVALMIVPITLLLPLSLSPAVVAVLFPLAILSGINLRAGRIGYWLGAMSYPLYAVHYPFLTLGLGWQAALSLVVVATAFACWVDRLRLKRQPTRRIENQEFSDTTSTEVSDSLSRITSRYSPLVSAIGPVEADK